MSYYSEREKGELPRDKQEINGIFWSAFVGIVSNLISSHFLAEKFAENCFEAPLPVGCNEMALGSIFQAEIPGLTWPLNQQELPETVQAVDAVEFFARYVSKPVRKQYHDYGRHDHLLEFDRDQGYEEYRDVVNRLFRRCQHPFELDRKNQVHRIAPPILQQVITQKIYTSDSELNRLISTAIEKFQDPRPDVREESLEKLWDAWERLKTHYSSNKKQSVSKLLDQAIPEPKFRERVDREAQELTDIGNHFMIRHTEVDRPRIERLEHIDYLFHRLFALVWMLLESL